MSWSNPSANSRAMTGRDRARFRAAVFKIHGDRCALCGEPATDADHIVPVWRGGNPHDPSNGQPLCRTHHDAKSNREAAEARAAARGTAQHTASRRHPVERHPGLR